MSVLEGAIIEYETNNPLMTNFIGEVNPSKIDILNVCEYLGINDNNFGNQETLDKVEKILGMVGENGFQKIQNLVSELGFKTGVLDEIYAKLWSSGAMTNQTVPFMVNFNSGVQFVSGLYLVKSAANCNTLTIYE